MTVWENVQLCLRSQPDLQDMAERKTTVRVSHPGSSYRRYNPESHVRWPLADLCEAAAQRRGQPCTGTGSMRGADQVLVMYDAGRETGLAWLKDRVSLSSMDVTAASTRGLERAGHADLLHAISDGFDWVLLEAASEENARLAQLREMELAACLGLEDRVVLFQSVEHLEQLLTEGISQLPVLEHRYIDNENRAKPTRRREALQLFASVTLSAEMNVIALPQDAPYGGIELTGDCTFCQACTWVCPTNALIGAENGGGLDFLEADCMQCGLCVSVCRQNAIRLVPRLELSRNRMPVSLTHQDFFWSDGVSGPNAADAVAADPVQEQCLQTTGGPLIAPAPENHPLRDDEDQHGPDDWPNGGTGSRAGEAAEVTDRAPATRPTLRQISDLRRGPWPDLARILAFFGADRADKLS
ncbi:4Fe-4S dicluster domain-containing protein [Phaeobacter gallaeciensis]|uniref:Pyruvate:ferredoxin oxidoreductase n=1 Tax=Phaeobacter gallaeciensis TaxID=60890 RepID=A0AAD0ED78_9RHOB|nr:4Fe-4S binding protein [Phaeobacter gallaeciensis]AHD09861.1 Pyruvate:ferredoxin oxidoreductase [Phaeobacter gallaeciensis DSM 26640]ATE93125.1 Pyruvate:ferredoxin oxidoreductase [Phaeobacter gallaeciensis]ATE97053.1 Pyruvate:ferredoxin oxidoreductase [Phaeobacter gallaeciensis]ATF01790.1 Pyruvate:ferredoxin oxidoreductase [Phaeobacter gallaeciensis]ATF06170.1 Pyruvate:ferredoxin oxidoreductase [Phaeobacter gallaeciensis]